MTRRVSAVFRLGFRAPFRSRFVWALLALLALVAAVLPASLKGDGTTAGDIRMILTWTFGPAFAILAAATMWSGCAAISTDIEEGRHSGAAVTPARPFELWAGRWLGLVFANALLLFAVAAGVFAQLRARGISAEETGVERRLDIVPESVARAADALFAQAVELGSVPPTVSEEEALASIKKDLATSFLPIDPGRSREWEFALRGGDAEKAVRVVFSYVSSMGTSTGCDGEIIVSSAGREILRRSVSGDDSGRAELEIPAGALAAGGGAFRASFANTGDAADGVSVLARHFESMTASVPDGGVLKNLALCTLLLLSALSALAGIGVALGTVFSFPVAAFAGAAVVFAAFIANIGIAEDGWEAHAHGGSAERGAIAAALDKAHERASIELAKFIAAADKPFIDAKPFDRLGDCVLIDARLAKASVIQTGIILPIIFGILAALALPRRELAF